MTTKINRALDNIADFSQEEKALIGGVGQEINVPSRWASMHQDTPADKVFLILDGEVSIRKNKKEVARLGAGEIVGERSFAHNTLRNATVVAETPLKVLRFTKSDWRNLISSVPALAEAVSVRSLARA